MCEFQPTRQLTGNRNNDRLSARHNGGRGGDLGDGDSLLLHNLVQGDTIKVAHFIKLINADNAAISKHHGSGLQTALAWRRQTKQKHIMKHLESDQSMKRDERDVV